MKHLAILLIVLGTMAGFGAIIRVFSCNQQVRQRFVRLLAYFVLLVWSANLVDLLYNYLAFNTGAGTWWLYIITTFGESLFTFAGLVCLILAIRLMIKRKLPVLVAGFFTIAAIIFVKFVFDVAGIPFEFPGFPRLVSLLIHLSLLAMYLALTGVIIYYSRAFLSLKKNALRYFALFIGGRILCDFTLQILHGPSWINYNTFLVGQYLVEIITYILIIVYARRFVTIVHLPDTIELSQAGINGEALDLFAISSREKEVIGLVLSGMSNREIADKLCISELTVKDHIYNIYKKTDVKNRVQLSNLFKPR